MIDRDGDDEPIKIGAKIVRHGRYITFQMAKVAVPKNLFRKILRLERFPFDGTHSRCFRLACAGVPDDRRAAVAA